MTDHIHSFLVAHSSLVALCTRSLSQLPHSFNDKTLEAVSNYTQTSLASQAPCAVLRCSSQPQLVWQQSSLLAPAPRSRVIGIATRSMQSHTSTLVVPEPTIESPTWMRVQGLVPLPHNRMVLPEQLHHSTRSSASIFKALFTSSSLPFISHLPRHQSAMKMKSRTLTRYSKNARPQHLPHVQAPTHRPIPATVKSGRSNAASIVLATYA